MCSTGLIWNYLWTKSPFIPFLFRLLARPDWGLTSVNGGFRCQELRARRITVPRVFKGAKAWIAFGGFISLMRLS